MPYFWNKCRSNPALLILLMAVTPLLATAATDDTKNPVKDSEGLWEYTGLVTKDGQSLPLTGVFLISDGTFVQQGIFNGEPFDAQGSMAHVGPYWGGGAGLRLTSNQTLSLDPSADDALTSSGVMQHDLKVERDGDQLTLIFGAGTSTVQTFTRLGDAGDTQLFAFANGGLAFADGYFILVIGDDDSAITGYGKYDQTGSVLTMNAIRWAASDGSTVINMRDATVSATFDDDALTLPGGQRFAIIK